MNYHHAWILPLLATSLSAQTFIVDANNGPGANFTQISAAVAAVPDGSVLLVRAGSYSTFAINAKSLVVRGEPGVVVTPSPFVTNTIAVLNLQPSQKVVLQDLTFASGNPTPFATPTVTCTYCQGNVCLDNLQCANNNNSVGQIWATTCSQLLMRGISNGSGWLQVRLSNCNAVFEDCEIGHNPSAPWSAPWALLQEGGTLQLVDCEIGGGVGGFLEDNAISMAGGELRLLGNTTITPGLGVGPSFAIGGTGAVRVDPSVMVLGVTPLGPNITATSVTMPALTSSFGGSTADAFLSGPSGGLGATAIAFPGPRVLVPGLTDAVWLDGSTLLWVGLGVLGAGAPLQTSVPFMPGPVPGPAVVWQGISYDAINLLQVSNPSLLVLP